MTVQCTINGVWIISDIIDGYLVSRSYYFMTRREAVKAFKHEQGIK